MRCYKETQNCLHNFCFFLFLPRAIKGRKKILTLLGRDGLWGFVRLFWPRMNVSRATIMKLMPPAKSVNLSNWKIAAIRKKISWMTRMVMADMAKWSLSNKSTAMALLRILPFFLLLVLVKYLQFFLFQIFPLQVII